MKPHAPNPRGDYYVTVCDKCLKASCWHGIFFCQDYQTAGTQEVLASELRKLDVEHPYYFSKKEILRVCGMLSTEISQGGTIPVMQIG
jgi:hypothetical protein